MNAWRIDLLTSPAYPKSQDELFSSEVHCQAGDQSGEGACKEGKGGCKSTGFAVRVRKRTHTLAFVLGADPHLVTSLRFTQKPAKKPPYNGIVMPVSRDGLLDYVRAFQRIECLCFHIAHWNAHNCAVLRQVLLDQAAMASVGKKSLVFAARSREHSLDAFFCDVIASGAVDALWLSAPNVDACAAASAFCSPRCRVQQLVVQNEAQIDASDFLTWIVSLSHCLTSFAFFSSKFDESQSVRMFETLVEHRIWVHEFVFDCTLFGADAFAAMAYYIEQNRNLLSINLKGEMQVHPQVLFRAIMKNDSVQSLKLPRLRSYDEQVYSELKTLLLQTKTLLVVEMKRGQWSNAQPLTAPMVADVREILTKNKTLRSFYTGIRLFSRDLHPITMTKSDALFLRSVVSSMESNFSLTDCDLRGFSMFRKRNLALRWRKPMHDSIVSFCINLWSFLPQYVLLDVFDQIPYMKYVNHRKKIELMFRVVETCVRKTHERETREGKERREGGKRVKQTMFIKWK